MNEKVMSYVNELINDTNVVIYNSDEVVQNEVLKYLKENKITHRYSYYDDYLYITTEEDGEED